jgi:hypothetical protein
VNSTGSTDPTKGDESIGRLVQQLQSAQPEIRAAAAQQLKAIGVRRQLDLQPSRAVQKLKSSALFTLGTIQVLFGLAMLALVIVRLLLGFAR